MLLPQHTDSTTPQEEIRSDTKTTALDIVSLGAAILLAAALFPYGIQLIMNKTSMSGMSQRKTGRD